MKVYISVRIQGKIDSRKLYDEIEHIGINLIDFGSYSLVYGELYIAEAMRVFYHCSLYGDTTTEVTHKV